jgi:hypothetical protein
MPNQKPNGASYTHCMQDDPRGYGLRCRCRNWWCLRKWARNDCTPLSALGHPQPPTPLKTDNSTAYSFVHSNIRQRRSKTWDMRWNWLRDKVMHKQLRIYWGKGHNNDTDYFTKNHPPAHHLHTRQKYVLNAHQVSFFISKLTARPARPFTPSRCEGVFLP